MDNREQNPVESQSEQLISEVVKEFLARGNYLRGKVARLVELVTSEDGETAELATGAFFTGLVETVADSFEPRSVSLYNRVFGQLIEHCRKRDRSGAIDSELAGFGLRSEEDLVARAEALRHKPLPASLARSSLEMRRIIVLSRVTLGADVAITSVIIERMKRACPRAGITLVGGRKAVELFGGDRRLSFKEISYRRAGTTMERLLSWIDVLGCIRELTDGLGRDQYLIVDPDSRLTQLGLLPVSPAEKLPAKTGDGYLFFPSREYGGDTSRSLSQLTSSWLDERFGTHEPTLPTISLAHADTVAAGQLVRPARRKARPVVSVNFGVGENPMKRVEGDFETRLVNQLIQDGAAVVLDMGAGEDERARATLVIRNACRQSRDGRPIRVVEVNQESLQAITSTEEFEVDLLVWSGRIGLLAALVGESDLYVGYDSAGQHIAAAAGVPSIDVFAGFSSMRMLDRWHPAGKAEARVVAVDPLARRDPEAILSAVLRHAREILSRRQNG